MLAFQDWLSEVVGIFGPPKGEFYARCNQKLLQRAILILCIQKRLVFVRLYTITNLLKYLHQGM